MEHIETGDLVSLVDVKYKIESERSGCQRRVTFIFLASRVLKHPVRCRSRAIVRCGGLCVPGAAVIERTEAALPKDRDKGKPGRRWMEAKVRLNIPLRRAINK